MKILSYSPICFIY